MEEIHVNLAQKTIWLRLAQMMVNERYKKGDFKVPVHLAMGHEAIAVAIDAIMQAKDALLLTHRNVHYNLARQSSLKEELDEYCLRENGLSQGRLGSMNLNNPEKGIPYSSSILANNLPVSCGYALGNKAKGIKAATFVTTGDGAMEEGAFYESLLFMKSYDLPIAVIIENNGWSLATCIEERRANINVERLVASLDIEYLRLDTNDVVDYTEQLAAIRTRSIEKNAPIVVEVKLTTLGYWTMTNEQHPDGKFINYHCGPASEVERCAPQMYPTVVESNADPLYVLHKHFSRDQLMEFSDGMLISLRAEFL